MTTTRRRLREARTYCAEHGLTVLNTVYATRGHPKIVVKLPDGSTKKIIISGSSVSIAGERNFQAFVRRLARGLHK